MARVSIFRVVFFIVIQNLLYNSCDQDLSVKYASGKDFAIKSAKHFFGLFRKCFETTMPNQKFLSNNIHNFINYPSKTTVGYSLKFTSNRKFFANMIGTVAFKNMLESDVQELKKDLIKKMKYCDKAALDQNLLTEFYDREVDLSKL